MAEDYGDVINLLTEWNLAQCIPVYIENAITTMTLALLPQAEIKELIPTIGHRTIFWRNLEEWRKAMHPATSSTPLVKDVENDYPDNVNGLYNNFPIIKEKIIELARKRTRRDKQIASLIGYLDCLAKIQESFAIAAIEYKRNPAPDGHRCGVCPTYFQKICAFDFATNCTYIFDNHCIMDLYNCIEGSDFVPMRYDKCLFFGNFGYVHGFKYEDQDYQEDHVIVQDSHKNPDFIR